MPKRDIQILPDKQGAIQFTVNGASEDTGLMLLQRIYTLMLADQDSPYRSVATSYSLLRFLDGGNRPTDGMMNSILAVSSAVTLTLLDEDDRNRIGNFYAVCEQGVIKCTLELADGTTIYGVLDV